MSDCWLEISVFIFIQSFILLLRFAILKTRLKSVVLKCMFSITGLLLLAADQLKGYIPKWTDRKQHQLFLLEPVTGALFGFFYFCFS